MSSVPTAIPGFAPPTGINVGSGSTNPFKNVRLADKGTSTTNTVTTGSGTGTVTGGLNSSAKGTQSQSLNEAAIHAKNLVSQVPNFNEMLKRAQN